MHVRLQSQTAVLTRQATCSSRSTGPARAYVKREFDLSLTNARAQGDMRFDFGISRSETFINTQLLEGISYA